MQGGAGLGGAGTGRVGSKKFKPILALLSPLPHPTTFAGQEKPAQGEAERSGSNGVGQNCHP